jgi:transposase
MARTTPALHRQLPERPEPLLPDAVALRHTLPGGGACVAETLGAAIGTDLPCGPTAGHLASWAGMGPGHHPSAGHPLSGHPRQGHVAVRGALPQAAWAATRTQPPSRAAQVRRLTTRVATRRALVAGGQSLRVMAWPVLSTHASDDAWGRDAVDRSDAQAYRLKLLRKLEALALQVVVEPAPRVSEASSCS